MGDLARGSWSKPRAKRRPAPTEYAAQGRRRGGRPSLPAPALTAMGLATRLNAVVAGDDMAPIFVMLGAPGRGLVGVDLATHVVASRPAACWSGRLTPPRASSGSTPRRDRKSTRLNSSHVEISYAVFCLKKKKKKQAINIIPTSAHTT